MPGSIKISVVIPTFNSSRFLSETLDSVLVQTLPAHEIVVVDDGSTDRTHEICRGYGSAIRFIPQQNQGISLARNAGIRAAIGDWIALLDHDDICLPKRLECSAASVLKNPDAHLHYGPFISFYEDGTRIEEPHFSAEQLWPLLRYRTPILPGATLIRRDALLLLGGFRDVFPEDWDLWVRIMHRFGASAFQDLSEPLLMYRRHTTNYSNQHHKVAEGMLWLLDDLLVSDLPALQKAIWRRRVQARIYYELSLEMRTKQEKRYLMFAFRSLERWPFFDKVVPARRYKTIAYSLVLAGKRPRSRKKTIPQTLPG